MSRAEFEQVQAVVGQRSPRNCSPRSLTSDYLLSGLIFCGRGGSSLQGCSAKSGRFHYYACCNLLKKGKISCSAKMVNRDRIESRVIGELQTRVLTERNLSELLRLTNAVIEEEMTSRERDDRDLERQINIHQKKLDNLYATLESGAVDLEDIAQRLRQRREAIAQLKEQQLTLAHRDAKTLPKLTKSQLRRHVADLRELLMEGSVFERKSFIKSFVKRITVTGSRVDVEYTYPTGNGNGSSGGGVLGSGLKSSPNATTNMTTFMCSHSPTVNRNLISINSMSAGCGERSLD